MRKEGAENRIPVQAELSMDNPWAEQRRLSTRPDNQVSTTRRMQHEFRKLEEKMARRLLRGHIYLTPDSQVICTSTTTTIDQRTGQTEVVGPRPVTEAMAAVDMNELRMQAIPSSAPDSCVRNLIAGVHWNSPSLVITGTTCAHALIMALHNADDYSERDLAELARQTPWCTPSELGTAFQEVTGRDLPLSARTRLEQPGVMTATPSWKRPRSKPNRNRRTPTETMFTKYGDELLQNGGNSELAVLIVRGIPRSFKSRTQATQRAILQVAPATTGTKWDGMLAAIAEHLAWLYGHPHPRWVEEPSRFNDPPTAYGPVLRESALATAPAAFLRHGVPIAGHELDARGGEHVQWGPYR